MKYYKDNEGSVYAFEEDGSQDHIIKDDMVLFTAQEAYAHENPRSPEQLAELFKAQEAVVFLVRTDYKMTSDYFAEMPVDKQEQLVQDRKDARELIRGTVGF
tara:strand:- start:11618 stop:11923 length:306 start_codon:yes stop_codon:yes gene_type:complete